MAHSSVKRWRTLRKGKGERAEYAATQVKQLVPLQLVALMRRLGLSQTELAKRSGVTQGVVSRAADPDYGNLSLNTLVKIAAGLDVALVCRFVPFSELTAQEAQATEAALAQVSTFEEEDIAILAESRDDHARDRTEVPAETASSFVTMTASGSVTGGLRAHADATSRGVTFGAAVLERPESAWESQ